MEKLKTKRHNPDVSDLILVFKGIGVLKGMVWGLRAAGYGVSVDIDGVEAQVERISDLLVKVLEEKKK